MTCATSEAETAYPSGAHEFTPGFKWVHGCYTDTFDLIRSLVMLRFSAAKQIKINVDNPTEITAIKNMSLETLSITEIRVFTFNDL